MNFLKVKVLIFFLGHFLLIGVLHAEDKKNLIPLIKKNLPTEIREVFFEAKNKQDIELALKKPDLVEDQTYFYIIAGFKYALSITFNKNDIEKIRFYLPKSGDPYSVFSDSLSNIPKIMENKGTHAEGRDFSTTDDQLGIKLVFRNNSEKNLKTITRTIQQKK